jgi:hypothetical protein
MAFTANTAFEARITNNSNDTLCNIAGKFYSSGDPADCSAGTLCVRGDLLACEGFPSGVYNENTYKMAVANSVDVGTPIYACNTYDNQLIGNGSNNYFIGRKTLGLGVPAGRYGNFTRIYFDGASRYRFGAGNVTLNTSTDTYFVISSGALSSQAAAPTATGTPYFVLKGTGKFVEGNMETVTYYDVEAHAVATVPAG